MFETIQINSIGIFNTMKLSLNGEKQNYKESSLHIAVFHLAIPMIFASRRVRRLV